MERLLDQALFGLALFGDVAAGALQLPDGAVGREVGLRHKNCSVKNMWSWWQWEPQWGAAV